MDPPKRLLSAISDLSKHAHSASPRHGERHSSFNRAAELAYVRRFHGDRAPGREFSTRGYNPKYAVARKGLTSSLGSALGSLFHGDVRKAAHHLIHRNVLEDCTNFVSQALHAGGWKEDGNWRYEGSHEVHGMRGSARVPAHGSASWETVKGFLSFALDSGRASRVPLSKATPGDIIILDQKSGHGPHFNPDHAMIIVKGTGHAIQVAGHGANRYDYPFFGPHGSASVTGANPRVKYIVLHIKS